MPTLAVSAVGLDRPGIIAGVAERLAAHGANITDSRMAILRGHFAMTLIVEGAERDELAADLAELGLEAYNVAEVAVGDAIQEGDTVVVLESMKMEMPVEAEDEGTVKEILVEEGQSVSEGDTLVELE